MLTHRLCKVFRRRPELVGLAGFGATAPILLAILKIASEIAEGETMAFDRWLLRALRGWAEGEPGLTGIMQGLTAMGSGVMLTVIVLIVAGYLFTAGKHGMALFLVLATTAGTILVALLKGVIDRPRPDVVAHWTSFSNASFPSAHAANSAIVYLTLAGLIARSVTSRALRIYVLAAAMLLTLLIGVSRLYLGVHWPTDVLSGWILGAGWALGCSAIAWWLQSRRAIEPPDEGTA